MRHLDGSVTIFEEILPLSVLDFVGIEHGEIPHASIAGAVSIAQAAETAGYRRYWVSEHHNMASLACSAPEILTAHVASTYRADPGRSCGDHVAEPLAVQGR